MRPVRVPRRRIYPEAEALEPGLTRGDLRLMAEVALTWRRGGWVPIDAHTRAARTLETLAR